MLLMPMQTLQCMLESLGHHASTCKCGGDVVFCHNRRRDIKICSRVMYTVDWLN